MTHPLAEATTVCRLLNEHGSWRTLHHGTAGCLERKLPSNRMVKHLILLPSIHLYSKSMRGADAFGEP